MRIYEYGCRPYPADEEAVVAQILAGHRYRNELVAIERRRRDAYAALMAEHIAREGDLLEQLAKVEAEIEERRQAIRQANSASRTKGDKRDAAKAVKELRGRASKLRYDIREAKRRLREDESVQANIEAINEVANAEVKAARAATEAFWGTYLHAEAAVQAAKKKPTPPRFHQWDGSGCIAVQLQGVMETPDLFRADTRVRVDPPDPAAWYAKGLTEGQRKWLSETTLWMRIGSEGRAPVWARFDMPMHRPLPPGRIRWVKVFRRRVGSKFHWVAQFTVEENIPPLPIAKWGRCAIDVGWRVVDGGLRVATLLDEAGHVDYLILPDAILDRLRKVADLGSIRGKSFNAAQKTLSAWLKSQSYLPEWLTEKTEHLAQWRSQSKLAALAIAWRSERFEGDEDAFEALEAWRKQDKHLWDWEANLRDKVLRRRRDLYRCWAKRVAETYQHVLIEDFDLRKVAQRKPAEEDIGGDEAARVYRTAAAISELREAMTYAVLRQGGTVEPPAERDELIPLGRQARVER